jgi:hypothetical protein
MHTEFSDATNLLSIARSVTVVAHIELNILKACTLSDLPVNATNVRFWVCKAKVDLEVFDVAEKVVLVHVPSITLVLALSMCNLVAYHC